MGDERIMFVTTDGHTVKSYDEALARLRSQVMEMGGLVEDQIARALKALDDEDVGAARDVVGRDHKINAMEVKIDEECTQLLALRQPMAGDLRMIMVISKAVTDLERIGDEAQKIARMVVQIYNSTSSSPSYRLFREVFSMGKLATNMLQGALDALARQDVDKAMEVAQGDDDLDREFNSAMRHLSTYMMEDARVIGHAVNVIFMVKALERIGDHAKNIAEYTIYLIKGKDVRHTGPGEAGDEARGEDD